jgi:hypothetical protein
MEKYIYVKEKGNKRRKERGMGNERFISWPSHHPQPSYTFL